MTADLATTAVLEIWNQNRLLCCHLRKELLMSLRNSQRESMQLRFLLEVALDADNPRPVATTAGLPILWISDFPIASDGMSHG